MKTVNLTCIECPMGCELEVGIDECVVTFVKGNSCARGKMYAENEVICPRRVLTTTVRSESGTLVPVKTEKPIKKELMMDIMKKIAELTCRDGVRIGDVVCENISEDINLVVSGNP